MTTFGNIQVFLLFYNLLEITRDHCQYHRFLWVVSKVFLKHLHSSYNKAAILLPPFSIYFEQAFVYFN